MDNFNAHKWFKKQYLEEGHTEDKMERDMEARKRSRLSPDELKKLDAMRAFYRGETDVLPAELKEDNLNEISRDTYDRMESLANQRELNELKDLIMILGGEWANEGFENEDIVDYFEVLVGQLVKM
jgi:hypothetical protein